MPRRRFTYEQIINHLRELVVLLSQGQRVVEVCRRLGIPEQIYDRWLRSYPETEVSGVARSKRWGH